MDTKPAQAPDAQGYLTDVPYIAGFYPDQGPLVLRYVAALNGFGAPALDSFDYCELGCGMGKTSYTLAAAFPQGRFVAVDLNREHIESARAYAEQGGLKNIRFFDTDFKSMLDLDLPRFDFVTCHGVHSWVSPEVRAQLGAVLAKFVKPGGVVFMSHNALPGWAHLLPIRQILLSYTMVRSGSSLDKVREGLRYLQFLREKGAQYFTDNPQAREYIDVLLKQDPKYLAHEYLHAHWQPMYFHDVAQEMARAGLTFCGSFPFFTNFWQLSMKPEFHDLFRNVNNRVLMEIHKDFIVNQRFRRDVYVRSTGPALEQAKRIDLFDGIYFRATAREISLPHTVRFGQVSMTINGPIYRLMLDALRPRSLSFKEILALPDLKATAPAAVFEAVNLLVASDLATISAHPIATARLDPAQPFQIASAFNRSVIERDLVSDRAVVLASELGGSGYSVGLLDALMLDLAVKGGIQDLPERVWANLVAHNRSLSAEGKPLQGKEAHLQVIERERAAFLGARLQALADLGIVRQG